MVMKRWPLVGAMVLVLCLLGVPGVLAGCSNTGAGREVAATFYDQAIYEDEVNDYTSEFREARTYTDDEVWAEYLAEQGLVAKTWRERVIGVLAEQRLVRMKSEDLGIGPDNERIEAQIAQDKESAGIDADDGAAWAGYLESRGETEQEYRASLEAASLEQQLYLHELKFDPVDNADKIAAFIKENLSDRVVLRYSALRYAEKDDAEAALAELKGLEGKQLKRRFNELADLKGKGEGAPAEAGDIGWDIAIDLGAVQEELNREMLQAGELSRTVHESEGAYYVMYCTDRFVFKADTGYDDIPDSDLKDFVLQSVTLAEWQTMANEYRAGLVEQAQVQVSAPPSDLPYDVDDLIPQTEAYQAGR